MNPEHISDSYDFVKRTLLSVRPAQKRFLAVPMFTDEPTADEEDAYRTILDVELIRESLRPAPAGDRDKWIMEIGGEIKRGPYHLFLDPDTGIRLHRHMPNGPRQRKYIGTDEIATLLQRNQNCLLLCFDQSLDRRMVNESRTDKLNCLAE